MTSQPTSVQSLPEMIAVMAKTFAIAHAEDTDSHLAQALVYNAGRLAYRLREQGLEVDSKSSVSDVVTQADRAAEQFVSTVLATLRPDDGIIGEEGAERESTSGRTWHIDPVDGTYNFSRGSDYFCSAVSLSAASGVLLGAVHRPAMGYTWCGGKDLPASQDGTAIKVTDGAAAATALATYLHPTDMGNEKVRDAWTAVASRFASVRMLGAGSVDLCGVASGQWGAWIQHSVADWDWLPGQAIVEAAGGKTAKVFAGGVEWSIAGNADTVAAIEEALRGNL